MITAVAAICIAASGPPAPYEGEPPGLIAPKPKLPASAASAAGFAPRGWKVERAITGDLNRDGRPDLAVILKGTDPKCVVPTENAGGSPDTNPRLLLVAFAGKAGFTLQLANATVIPRTDDPYMDDPLNLDDFAIRGGVLRLALNFWRSMGGWTTYSSTLSFRWDGQRFPLIGFDRETLRRNSGETETLSVNYLTGRTVIAKGSIEDDARGTSRQQRIPVQKTASLETFGNGLDYEPKLTGRK